MSADRISAREYRASVSAPSVQATATRALGRLKSGEMNKTEKAYSERLEERRRSGEVQAYWFESMTLKLADDCRYTPDFLVMLRDGSLEAHEVKGNWFVDDAKVKIKVAAGKFPYRFILVRALPKRDGGGWSEQAI